MFKIVLVGRPNVGKSTLFNRLVGARNAIVNDQPGVTRDRKYGKAKLVDLEFTLIDTAGIDDLLKGNLDNEIKFQTDLAIDDADLIIFVNGNMGSFAAINRFTGNVIWKKQYESFANINSYFSDETIAIYRGPVLVNSKLLFSDHYGMIRILDANTGTEIESLSVGKLALAPIPVDKKVFFLRSDGKLLAYE